MTSARCKLVESTSRIQFLPQGCHAGVHDCGVHDLHSNFKRHAYSHADIRTFTRALRAASPAGVEHMVRRFFPGERQRRQSVGATHSRCKALFEEPSSAAVANHVREHVRRCAWLDKHNDHGRGTVFPSLRTIQFHTCVVHTRRDMKYGICTQCWSIDFYS